MGQEISRRNFFKITATSGAATTINACGNGKDPIEKLIPLLNPPIEYTPGVSTRFATTCRECDNRCGLIVRTREGRAVKIEGNPHHPMNAGAICPTGQAILQGLYNPLRLKQPTTNHKDSQTPITWKKGLDILTERLKKIRAEKKKKILFLASPENGTLGQLRQDWLQAMGGGTMITCEASPLLAFQKANELSFGHAELPELLIDRAELLLNFGTDFLESWLHPVRQTRQYGKMHGFRNGHKGKAIHIAPRLSMTGSNTDEWFPCSPGAEEQIALAITTLLLPKANHLPDKEKKYLNKRLRDFTPKTVSERVGFDEKTIQKLAVAFSQPGKGIALSGGNETANKESTRLHVAVNLLNHVAGNIGKTILFGTGNRIESDTLSAMEEVIAAMNREEYDLVILENVNPAYSLPKSSGFQQALEKVPFSVLFSTESNETSELVNLNLPTAHFLESWGDCRVGDVVHGLNQPVMTGIPGYEAMETGNLLLRLAKEVGLNQFGTKTFHEYLKNSWRKSYGHQGDFETFWKESLRQGGFFQTFQPVPVTLKPGIHRWLPKAIPMERNGLTLIPFNTSRHNAKGNNGNRSWLQEIPDPITQVVWDSWLEIHPVTAKRYGITQDDLIEVSTPNGKAKLGAWLYQGIEPGCIAIPTGLGRKILLPNYENRKGTSRFIPILEPPEQAKKPVEKVVGMNVQDLLAFEKDSLSGAPVLLTQVTNLRSTGKKASLVRADGQHLDDQTVLLPNNMGEVEDRSQKARDLVLTTTTATLQSQQGVPSFPEEREERPKSDYKWEMIIDLDRCVGCSACVAACYAENNIPVVGKERFAAGHDMSWIRVERYVEWGKKREQFEIRYAPSMCGQCENAGCEPVCPVYATYHTGDGINSMIYNRCIGSRFCSNNCPYKQRKFNWRNHEFLSPLHFQLNPDISVRGQGVMEKCDFCYSRIREAKDRAKDQKGKIADGQFQTACQQTCPADAILFGNTNDRDSKISKEKEKTRRGYTQLKALNYKPSITYLKKVKHDKTI